MQERCENCKHWRELKHNFKVGIGYEHSHCCVLWVNEEDAFILETEEYGMCECFTERKTK